MSKRVTAFAEVEIVLRIQSGSTWGSGCTLDQIHSQAIDGALGKLRKATNGARDFKLIGTPKVIRVQSKIED